MNKILIPYFCKCGNEISGRTALYGNGTCMKCHGKKVSRLKTGVPRPLWVRKKVSEGCKGRIPWNKGKKCPQTSGDKNGSWKGGTTPVIMSVRRSKEYIVWRSKVFERDKYTCQKCSAKGCYLEAHHKVRFATIWAKYNIKTKEEAFNCKPLWHLSLGQTLCLKCHNKTKGRKRGDLSSAI